MTTENTFRLERITTDSPYLQTMSRIIHETFPPEELLEGSPEELFAMIKGDAFALVDGEIMIGFVVSFHISPEIVYFMYMAIDPTYQDQGYGTRALQLIQDYYGDVTAVFSIESLNVDCDNPEQRKARLRFYERYGLHLIDREVTDESYGKMQFMSNRTELPEEVFDLLAKVL